MVWILLVLSFFPFQLRLIVPAAEINAPVTRFYLDGVSWEIDPWEEKVGHLEGTTRNIVLGGHFEYPNGQSGVFGLLNQVEIGDTLILTVGGMAQYYTVIETRTVADTDLSVVYPTSDSRLTLITCDDASYNAETGLYSERLVVIATPTEFSYLSSTKE